MTTIRARARSLIPFLALAALALWLGSGPALRAGTGMVTAAAGGSVTSADGVLTIEFPAGAVPADTLVSIHQVPAGATPAAPVGSWQTPVYALSPPGIGAGATVTATWTLDGALAPPDGDPPPPPALEAAALLIPFGGATVPRPLDDSLLVHGPSSTTLTVGATGSEWFGLAAAGHALLAPPDGDPPPPPADVTLHQEFAVAVEAASGLDPATEGRFLAPLGSSGPAIAPYAEWPMVAAGGDDALEISEAGDHAAGVLDFACHEESSAARFGATVTLGWDFAAFLPVEQTVAFAGSLGCVAPPDLHLDLGALGALLDPDGDGLFTDSADLAAMGAGSLSPLGGGGALAPPDGDPPPPPDFAPPDGDPVPPSGSALIGAGPANGLSWAPPAGYCSGSVFGFNDGAAGAPATVEVVTASGSTYFTLTGDHPFNWETPFTGLPGDGSILEVRVRYATGGAGIWALALTACP